MKQSSKIKARIKGNGSIIKGDLAKVFIKIGIAEEIQDEIIPDGWKEKLKRAYKKKVKK